MFIDTDSDRRHVEDEAGQRKCGEAIASAIAGRYNLIKKSVTHTDAAAGGIHCGDTVKIIGKTYATGQRIPEWVKLQKHTVKNIDTRTGRALLKEINSWVYLKDLTVVTSATAEIAPGSTVTIKPGAVYGGLTATRGRTIPKNSLLRRSMWSRNTNKCRRAGSIAQRHNVVGGRIKFGGNLIWI